MALLLLLKGWLCVSGQKQMCHLCGWLKLFLKNVRWEKIKIQKRWLLGRLSDGSFVQSFVYVLFCRSFLLCRLLGLQVTRLYTHILQSYLHPLCCICLYDTCSAKLKRASLFPNENCLIRRRNNPSSNIINSYSLACSPGQGSHTWTKQFPQFLKPHIGNC